MSELSGKTVTELRELAREREVASRTEINRARARLISVRDATSRSRASCLSSVTVFPESSEIGD